MAPSPWPRFMKLGTLAAFLDVSEPTIRDLEKRGIIPKRHPILGGFDSESVIKALAKAATGEGMGDAEQARIRTLEKLRGAAQTRRRNGAHV